MRALRLLIHRIYWYMVISFVKIYTVLPHFRLFVWRLILLIEFKRWSFWRHLLFHRHESGVVASLLQLKSNLQLYILDAVVHCTGPSWLIVNAWPSLCLGLRPLDMIISLTLNVLEHLALLDGTNFKILIVLCLILEYLHYSLVWSSVMSLGPNSTFRIEVIVVPIHALMLDESFMKIRCFCLNTHFFFTIFDWHIVHVINNFGLAFKLRIGPRFFILINFND